MTEIDCIYDGDFSSMKENIFRRVYKNFSRCHPRHYDAVLLSEKSPADFDAAFYLLKDIADSVITFARNGSELAKHIQGNKDKFKKVDVRPSFSGQWFFAIVIRRRKILLCMSSLIKPCRPNMFKLSPMAASSFMQDVRSAKI